MIKVRFAVVFTCLSTMVLGADDSGKNSGDASARALETLQSSTAIRSHDVNDALDVRASAIQVLDFAEDQDSKLLTNVVVDGKSWTLELQKHTVRAPDFEVWVQDASGGLMQVEPPPANTYKGRVLEMPGAEVRASYENGELDAIIQTADEIFGVQPLSKSNVAGGPGEHAVYRNSDWINRRGFSCATELGLHQFAGLADLEQPTEEMPSGGTAATTMLVAEIALDADYEFYQLNGSNVNATVQDMENVINGVAAIYESQLNITYQISSVVVRTAEPDPYSTTNYSTILSQFVSHWNAQPQASVRRDTAHLFTGKDLDGSVIGIAYIGAVCNQNWAYGLSQSRFTTSMTSRIALTAHELGHNWNAQHCNGCAACANCCQIMCSGLGGCSGVITSFGCQELSQISAFRDTRTCLSTSIPGCTTNADCNDGLYCNGTETCVAGTCQGGTPPNCNDGIACTVDSCNEAADQCVHTPNNALCDDGVFCNGDETCSATGCRAGSPPCAAGTCDENTDQCGAGGGTEIWLVFVDSTAIPGVGTVQNEDIVRYDSNTATWSWVFDGSDVGLSSLSIDGLAVLPSGDLLLSFTVAASLPGMTGGPSGTNLDDSDIVRFIPTSLGATTAGSFVFYFDGSDVGLTTDDEDVDAITLTSDGRLVLSTLGYFFGTGATGDDKDLFVFNQTSLGAVTAGSFAYYFDGSDVGLTYSNEDVDAASLAASGTIMCSTLGSFNVPGVSGADEDIFVFTPYSLGPATSGSYSTFLDLSTLGISIYENVNALEIVE